MRSLLEESPLCTGGRRAACAHTRIPTPYQHYPARRVPKFGWHLGGGGAPCIQVAPGAHLECALGRRPTSGRPRGGSTSGQGPKVAPSDLGTAPHLDVVSSPHIWRAKRAGTAHLGTPRRVEPDTQTPPPRLDTAGGIGAHLDSSTGQRSPTSGCLPPPPHGHPPYSSTHSRTHGWVPQQSVPPISGHPPKAAPHIWASSHICPPPHTHTHTRACLCPSRALQPGFSLLLTFLGTFPLLSTHIWEKNVSSLPGRCFPDSGGVWINRPPPHALRPRALQGAAVRARRS